MAKKTDSTTKPDTAAPSAVAPAAPAPAKRTVKAATPKPKAKAPAKKAKAPAAKAKKPAAKATAPAKPKFTQDDVALRAYFISEKRRAHGLPGDEHQDWIEAERQLLAESAQPKKAKKV